MPEQVTRVSLADQAADLILARVRSGEWRIGDKLPGETTLAPQLDVGRSTVREAIRRLAGLGVLTTRQGAGVFVAALDIPADPAETVTRADIVTVIEARLAVETEAAALAARRRSDADLRDLRRGLAARAQAVGDVAAHVDADLGFHRGVVVAAANPILLDLYDLCTPRIRAAMIDMLELRGTHGDAPDHHRHEDLLDAIADGRADDAAAIARRHLTAMKESVA